jgi:hypothetical protein
MSFEIVLKVARIIFDQDMPTPHQLHAAPFPTIITASDLLHQTGISSNITLPGICNNVKACLLYLDAWLKGTGSVAVDGLMEDLATMEISRTQLWQWIHHKLITRQQCQGYVMEICNAHQISLSSNTVHVFYQLIDPTFFYEFTSTAMPILLRNISSSL